MEKKVGIYIHIPFCKRKCAYCNFYSLSGDAGGDKHMSAYKTAVIKHIEEYSAQLDGYLIDTVYFGGGTPSHFGAMRLIEILTALKNNGHVLLDSEITVEVNPASITKDEMIKLRRAGFNRLSVGVQCADNTLLRNLDRTHTFEDAEQTFKDARLAGFKNLSADIIFGLPSQTKDIWTQSVQKVAGLKAEHISCYSLKIDERTELYAFKDSPFLPDDDTQADMYLYAVDILGRFGYKQYEISNFARRGFESKHNMKYWLGEEYIGFGPGAHSYINQSRYSFTEDVEKYIEQIKLGERIVEHEEEMSDFENAGEYLMLRLRTTRGISEEEYYHIYRLKMDLVLDLLREYEKKGLAVFKDDRWRFTPKGFLLSNTLIGDILEAQTRQRTQISKPWQKDTAGDSAQFTLFDNRPLAAGLFGGKRLVGRSDLH